MSPFLRSTDIIDAGHPSIVQRAAKLAAGHRNPVDIARACFEWVRDEILHSADHHRNPVNCRASDVLRHATGYCYAKSHLLAALLRANAIPAGLCYQRLAIDDEGHSYCLHGLIAVRLPDIGWYRIDARGNKPGLEAAFTPPQECLPFRPIRPGEVDFPAILPDPLDCVVRSLRPDADWQEVMERLPDATIEQCPELAAPAPA